MKTTPELMPANRRLSISEGATWLGFIGLSLAAMASALGQTQVFVQNEGRQDLVVAMDGEYPIIQVDDRRERVFSTRMSLQPAQNYTDGGIRILEKDAIMGQDYGSINGSFFFRFRAEIEADRDFEDCFILFIIAPAQGDETIRLREINDIEADRTDVIDIILPVNPGFSGGGYSYYIFTQGEQILVDDPLAKAMIRQQGSNQDQPSAAPRSRPTREPPQQAFPAKATKMRMPDFPEILEGADASGIAQITFTIDQTGRVIEFLDMRADHAAFLLEARACILESEFEPAKFENQPFLTTVSQVFTFNEFVSFAEALEMVPYPSLQNHEPRMLYSPIFQKMRMGGAFDEEGQVQLEAFIDTLGRIRQPRIVETTSDMLAQIVLDSVSDWVYLPAVESGRPTARSVLIPIAFESAPAE